MANESTDLSTADTPMRAAHPGSTGDLLIAGGGYVGLCAALAVKVSAPHLGVTVVDLAPADAAVRDTRASAIAAAASRMLEQLGVWQQLAADAQPINEMIVTDSRLNDAVRPVFLTFADEPTPAGAPGQSFAHMIANRDLVTVLRRRCEEEGVELLNNERVSGFSMGEAAMHVTLGSGESRNVKLLVAADGVRSQLRELAGIRTVHWPYNQSGIVVTVKHEREHLGRAEEHFLPAGPFAILPLKGNRSSLVWTERTDDARRLLEADEFTFGLELERRFGHKLGEISIEGKPRAYPLGLTLARDYVRERFALAGDAAHGIHPIAGQGLNLGFKDAAALAQTIVEADRLGLDIGSLAVLENYERWRRFDTVRMGVVTDVLNRLFSNDNALVRAARSFGLGVVDRMPGLKKQFINQAAGRESGSPRLLQGEPI
jgi:2-octaprenyl-6-methoxyphenol hydroxylase